MSGLVVVAFVVTALCTFGMGFSGGVTYLKSRQPPKIKRLMREYDDDCQPVMLVGIDPTDHRRDFERRWEIEPKKPRGHPRRCQCEQCTS